MKRRRENHQEAATICRATATDTLNGRRLGRFAFSADRLEEARERAWRIADSRYGNDIDVRVARISR